ncbi:SWF or SNF family helicase [Streptomyces sp. NPDC049585]|uniref:SWIM zinc finger family protein n=1 Tax=Streptomyces sp. NPDC049585 TaxID=3155154 RepID=UPI00341396FD
MTDATAKEERVFAALPPVSGGVFARSWWGRAWLQALEDTALDGAQVKAGRRYARAGAVGAISVRPGRVTALVRDRDGTPQRADVLVRTLPADDWERLLELVAGRAGYTAALLDHDLPQGLAEDAAASGCELLPGIGDLEAECACEAWDHCAHTVALCHQVARLLDEDPFVLLLIRGRAEAAVLDGLRARSAPAARDDAPAAAPEPPAGVSAREAFAGRAGLPPLPAPPPAVGTAGRPVLLSVTGAEDSTEVDLEALEFLAAVAAERARLLLAAALAPGHELTPVPAPPAFAQDLAHLAASGPPGRVAARLAAAG